MVVAGRGRTGRVTMAWGLRPGWGRKGGRLGRDNEGGEVEHNKARLAQARGSDAVVAQQPELVARTALDI